MFLEKLVEIISSSYSSLAFWYVCNEYEGGVILRFGRYTRNIKPGIGFKCPIADYVVKTNVAMETKHHDSQTLTTSDGQCVCLSSLVAFSVQEVKKFLIDVEDAESVIADCVMTEISQLVVSNDYAFFMSRDFDEQLLERARERAASFGIKVHRVGMISRFKFQMTLLTKTD